MMFLAILGAAFVYFGYRLAKDGWFDEYGSAENAAVGTAGICIGIAMIAWGVL